MKLYFQNQSEWLTGKAFTLSVCLSLLQTPRYWVNKTVPGRVRETLGSKMKFIVILRDPVDRLHSDYNFNVSEYVLYCG